MAPRTLLAHAAPTLSEADKAGAIDALERSLRSHYIHQDRVSALSNALTQRRLAGAYATSQSAPDFAHDLSRDLIELSQDYHFSVTYDPDGIRARADAGEPAALKEDALDALEQSNFGFQKLEILEGNIGYIRFDYFPDPAHAFAAGAGAMQFVENTDALIIDMRYNRGGHNQFGQFITSYLFAASEHRLIHEYAYMDAGKMVSGTYWTLPALPGKRLVGTPVYVLTSTTTFSAGEWFAYELQKLGRAKLIGQRTTGASHAVSRVPIDENYLLQVPVGIGKDPIDKSDFEGVGVQPDIVIDAHLAKFHAHKMALDDLAKSRPEHATEYAWLAPLLAARRTPPTLTRNTLNRFTGAYDGRDIVRIGNRLIYRWRERFNLALIPLTGTLFGVEGDPDLRFQFVEANGQIVALEKIEKTGKSTRYDRQK